VTSVKFVVSRWLKSVEAVDFKVVLVYYHEQVTSVRKPDFPAVLYGDRFYACEVSWQNVHDEDFFCKADNQMESWWMESYTLTFITCMIIDFKLFCLIVPNFNGLIFACSSDKLFSHTNIDGRNVIVVEVADHIFKTAFLVGSI